MKNLQTKDFELVVSGGNRRWLQSKADELSEVWAEIVKIDQLVDVALSMKSKNNIFIFQNQTNNLFINKEK